ncbi:hypothetical protein HLH33_18600 [Gluconacetobacter diazotrophicus]|uniref:Uncharacterized protein n=1 Tax=Gluconacetobacter diazotrophicus TaxID=33996 RepID=A0A7W4I8K1_GLUDI|nr:hypothetical protein [Gluconacetobacter diazotrophicus]MBB2158275.1 hypothetical protein [Gluconacetobacter diazotrophicus]
MRLLIGPTGRIFYPYSEEFFKYVGYFGQDVDLISYSIKNLGFSSISVFPRYTHICFRPALFPRACLQRVLETILLQPPPRIVLERAGSLFAPLEILQNVNDAVARLRTLQVATPDEDEPPGSPNVIGLSLDRLRDPKRASMRAAFEIWKKARRYTRTQNVATIATNPVFGGGAVAWMPGQDRCLIEAWPQTYKSYGDVSHESFLGFDVRDLPDSAYIVPTTRSYFAVAHRQEPRLELIEAQVTRDDGSKFWSRYERLILPWRTSASDTFVSSVPLVRLIRNC